MANQHKAYKAYIVTYELNASLRSYRKLFKTLQSYDFWWHYIDNTWIIGTNKDPDEIFEHLQPYIDEDEDYLLIIEVRRSFQGWLPEDAWDWVERYIPPSG